MMAIPIRKISLALFFLLGSLLPATAQPSLKTVVDKGQILIGEQVKMKVSATLPPNDFFVKWIEIPDSLQHFELVERSKIDSVFTHQKLTGLSQTLTFTSFDSGKWTMPAFNVDFNPTNGDKPYELYTDSFPVTVSYQRDSTNVIRDIKDIREAPAFSYLQLLIVLTIAGLIFLLLLAWLLYFIIDRRSRRKTVAPARINPYGAAMAELEKLKQLNLQDAVALKLYHTRLSEIFKQYLSSLQGPDFASSTTGEVLVFMNQKNFDKTNLSRLAETLRRSDAAKFARYLPSAEESHAGWNAVKDAIDYMQQLSDKKESSGT